MAETFVKLLRSNFTDYLLENHPNAFLLLTLIAKRARRTDEIRDGLEVGECFIGDHKKCGLTRQEYRTALKILEDLKIVTIQTNQKNCKKLANSTTKTSTNKGTLVKLINREVYDINIETPNHQNNQVINQLPTNCQPTANHKQECKEVKNVKKQQPQTPSSKVEPIPNVDFVAVSLNALRFDRKLADEDVASLRRQAFSQDRLDLAVEYVNREPVINTSVIQTIVWHCKQPTPPKPKVDKQTLIETNRSIAKQKEGKFPFQTLALNSSFEIVYNPMKVDYIKYDDPNFEEKINALQSRFS